MLLGRPVINYLLKKYYIIYKNVHQYFRIFLNALAQGILYEIGTFLILSYISNL